jgi:hypothetical protein
MKIDNHFNIEEEVTLEGKTYWVGRSTRLVRSDAEKSARERTARTGNRTRVVEVAGVTYRSWEDQAR